MKKFITICLSLLCALGSHAQQRSAVTGVIYDSVQKQGLLGAVVELIQASDTTQRKQAVTSIGGKFTINDVKLQQYTLRAIYLGYQTAEMPLTVKGAKFTADTLVMRQGIELKAVVKEAQALRTSQNGDTIIYNADAFKVTKDAEVESLLAKMPGVKVEDGKVEAQGEEVKKILVDGREFFGDDVSTAIKTLPAEAVKSVEVFDKLSDNAEFTGMDDGEGYKAINIVTHNNMRKGTFGKVYGGVGYEPKKGESDKLYGIAGGNVSFFNNTAKWTVMALANNLNQQNFSFDDILGVAGSDRGAMVRPTAGIAHAAALKINLVDTWGKKKNFKFEGNYSFNTSNTTNDKITDREYYLTQQEQDEAEDALFFSRASGDNIYSRLYSLDNSEQFNMNHRIFARMEYKNENHRLMIRPVLSYQTNRNDATSQDTYYPVDSLGNIIVLPGWNTNKRYGINGRLGINYSIKLGKSGRTLNFSFDGNYSKTDANRNNLSMKDLGDTVRQKSVTDNYSYSLNGGITYTEPVSKSSQLTLDYRIGYNYSNADKLTRLYKDGVFGDIDPAYSNTHNTDYITHRVGPGYNYNKDGNNISASVSYQYSTLTSNRTYPISTSLPKTSFNNVTYAVMTRFKFNQQNSLRFRISSSTSNPSADQLQDVVDISNVNNISAGNPNLVPSYTHRGFLRYQYSGLEKGTSLMINIGGQMTQNYIANYVVMNSPGYEVKDSEGNTMATLSSTGQFSKPVNMDGFWRVFGGIGYGFPINFIKSNLNIDLGGSFQQSPTYINAIKNISKKVEGMGGITIGSNISEYVDFTLRYNASYNKIINSFNSSSNSEYLRHGASGNIKFVAKFGLTATVNATYNQYLGLGKSSLNNEYLLLNASVGMKVGKRQLGELSVFANDILGQNQSFSRNWAATYTENVTNSIIGRYFGVQFVYNIRCFGKKGSKDASLYEGIDNKTNFEGTGMGRRTGGFGPGFGGPPPGR